MLTEREKLLLLCVCGAKSISKQQLNIDSMKSRKQERRFYIHPLNADRKLDHGVHQSLGCTAPHDFVSYLFLFIFFGRPIILAEFDGFI